MSTGTDEKYRGEAYAAFGVGRDVAEVTVDLTTYAVTWTTLVALQEVGKVLHPVLREGQITGDGSGDRLALYGKGGLAERPHDQQSDDE